VGAPGRYWLWGLGLTVDLLVMFTVTGTRLMEGAQKRFDHAAASRHRAAERGHRQRPNEILALEVVTPDRSHLAERLGLYVIIVLGEGIVQVTSAASDVRWDLALLYGHAGVPHLAFHVGAAWLVWPLVAAVAWHLSYELHHHPPTT
jgi:hypothetical protein